MRKNVLFFRFFLLPLLYFAQKLPKKKELLKAMTSANAYFMNKWPDVSKPIVGKDREVAKL